MPPIYTVDTDIYVVARTTVVKNHERARLCSTSNRVVSTHEGDTDEADSSMDKDKLEDDDQVMGDDDDGENNQEGSEGTSAGDVESETEAEGRDGVGVSTSAGVAVDGRVVRRRRPGVIIEEYRGATMSSEDEEDGGETTNYSRVCLVALVSPLPHGDRHSQFNTIGFILNSI